MPAMPDLSGPCIGPAPAPGMWWSMPADCHSTNAQPAAADSSSTAKSPRRCARSGAASVLTKMP